MTKTKSITLPKLLKRALLIAALPVILTGLSACSGDDGATGATGPAGPAGPVTTTNETCMVCHTTGRIADITDQTGGVHNLPNQDPNTLLTVSNIQLTNVGGNGGTNTYGTLDVSFHVTDSTGAAVANLAPAGTQIRLADLSPSNTIPIQGNLSGQNYQVRMFQGWAAQGDQSAAQHVDWTSYTDNGGGNYTVRLAPEHDPADQLLDEAAALQYVDLATHIQRVAIMISGQPNTSIATLPAIGVGVKDFTGVPLNDGDNTTLDATLQYQDAAVTVQACQKCHGPFMQGTQHGNYWADTRICAMCHNKFYFPGIETDKALIEQWIHEIHNGQIQGRNDFSEVEFPQPITNCVACHVDPDGLTAGSDANMNAWMGNPSATACTSCHETVNPLNINVNGVIDGVGQEILAGANHYPGGKDANSCWLCHGASGGPFATTPGTSPSIAVAHDPTKGTDYVAANDPNTPEFEATIDIALPGGDHPAFFAEGDTPVVTVTLTDYATGNPVDPSVYTTPLTNASAAGSVAGGALSQAEIFVYGPRAKAVPVLTPGSTTDPAWVEGTAPVQGVDVRVGAGANVLTDDTGFHYQLQALPAGMTAGTYMVGIQFIDDSATHSGTSGLITFQIGTDVESPKVAGDSCTDCHGDTRMHGGVSSHSHNVPFDTDYCNMCHDRSGNYGDPIANRVHAVHAASKTGDLANRDWSEVAFPRDIGQCSTCHTSTSTSYRTDVYTFPCIGCHGDQPGATDHMLQNGGVTAYRR